MTPNTPSVTVCIASANTAMVTELCLRSLAAHEAGVPYTVRVGDCGSTDKTLPLLMRFVAEGKVHEVELAVAGRRHADWLDQWVQAVPDGLLLFLDSDVEIRRDGWIAEMINTLGDRALCMASLEPENPNYRDLVTGAKVRMARRPSMHCLLIRSRPVSEIGRSFEKHDHYLEDGSFLGHDVGAWVLNGTKSWATMPAGWEGRTLRHYQGLSWRKSSFKVRLSILVRLYAYRLLGDNAKYALRMVTKVRRLTRLRRIQAVY